MTLTITDGKITSDRTEHTAELRHFEPGDAWRVSWLPKRLMDRNAAITAMTLAEQFDRNGLWDHRSSANIDAWAAELGLSGPQAIAMLGGAPQEDEGPDGD